MGPHDTAYEMRDSPSLKAISPVGILEPLDAHDTSAKKVRLFLYGENYARLLNALCVCNFGPAPRGALPIRKLVELVEGITGFETSLWDLMKAGERCVILTRCFNVRDGYSKKRRFATQAVLRTLRTGVTERKENR